MSSIDDSVNFTSFGESDVYLEKEDHTEEDEELKKRIQLNGAVCRLGGFSAPAFDKDNNILQRGWTKAPVWRRVRQGLNFEGICENSDCQAHKKMVWSKWGYKNHGRFDWSENYWEVTCPCCEQEIEIKNIGFSTCWWQVSGVRAEKGKKTTVPWTEVKYADDTGVTTFLDKDKAGTKWLKLEVSVSEVRPVRDPIPRG